MKCISPLLLSLVAVCLFTCNNDDDTSYADDLVGTWELIDFRESGSSGNNSYSGEGSDYELTVSFTDNPSVFSQEGTFMLTTRENTNGILRPRMTNSSTLPISGGEWELMGDVLTTNGSANNVNKMTIQELTNTGLEIWIETNVSITVAGTTSTSNHKAIITFSRQ